ncbi:hypothetical protein [Natranaerofaba carboxydovora]|uniref:hypothetical protein n=1 Tax=Natranaerofaba carboxydovora TaxID=2742683 RepID=UPI001F131345|nr:hypothetical protein [Natranaerofaba carboxydovora]UMZ74097.1 hypothetical protein ACONDI_01676 [Natranaerofaba carboxydovora]
MNRSLNGAYEISETKKIARLGLMTAATVIFYLQIGPWIDVVLPVIGCILRPMIVVFFLTSFFHLQALEIIAPTLFGSALYAFLIVCPLGWFSLIFVPVSFVYTLIYVFLRNRFRPEINFTLSAIGSGIILLFLISLVLPAQFQVALRYMPVVVIVSVVLGLIQKLAGRIDCHKCEGCG